jgi:hypothetical protein
MSIEEKERKSNKNKMREKIFNKSYFNYKKYYS